MQVVYPRTTWTFDNVMQYAVASSGTPVLLRCLPLDLQLKGQFVHATTNEPSPRSVAL